jgi:thiol-disulfide isomerase/thioredoxin
MKSIFFFSAFFLTLAAGAQTKTIEFDHGAWKDILARAKKENKMIYVDCFTTWCGPCKWMAKNVFTDDAVADFYNSNFINAKIDMEKGEGVDLAKQYKVSAFPTMLYLDAEGRQLHRTCGSTLAVNFIENGKDALDPEKRLATTADKFGNGTADGHAAARYFSMLENACMSYDIPVGAYLSGLKDEELLSSGAWEVLYNFVHDPDSKPFAYLESNREKFARLHSPDSVEMKINEVYLRKMNSEKEPAAFNKAADRLRATGVKDAEKTILKGRVRFLLKAQNYNDYAKAAGEYFTLYNDLQANDLNSIAWTIYQKVDDKALLEKAAEMAKKATELDNSYPTNDTYAAVLYKLKRKKEAKAAAENAIALAKKDGSDYKETESLLKKINKLKD